MGVFIAYTQVVLSRLYSTPQHPERPNQRPINVEYFQAQHPSRANQPIALTSTVSKHWSLHSVRVRVRVRVRVGWYLLILGSNKPGVRIKYPLYGGTE